MFDPSFWYKKTKAKFLQNIDTFYYSIRLKESFTRDDHDWRTEQVRKFCQEYKDNALDGASYPLGRFSMVYRFGSFAGMYNTRFELPEKFDFFIAPVIPPSVFGDDESKTSVFVVQLRSRFLWEQGVYKAFEESFEFVKLFCDAFKLHILEVKENRCDFAFHTNYHQNPEKYFRMEHFFPMQVSVFKDLNKHYSLHKTFYENDYINLGSRGGPCFVRIYNKTKEVVEQGYKGWFLSMWLLNGAISQYDHFCLEEAYKQHNWMYLHVARLHFALDHFDDLTDMTKKRIKDLMFPENGIYNYDAVRALANELTPPVTIILNFEFQVMRKMIKSFELIHYHDTEDPTISHVVDFLDNRALIIEYLTRKTLRLCTPESDDSNKSRREDTDFWKRLRSSKPLDYSKNDHDLKLIRNRSSKIDLSIRKTRAANAISSVGFALRKDVNSSIYDDAADVLALLNDNDFHKISQYKKRLSLRDKEDIPRDVERQRCIQHQVIFMDPEDGLKIY